MEEIPINTDFRAFIIGVAGGTGSGKTTVSRRIWEAVGRERIAYIQHDNYYKDQSHLTPEQRALTNYDHPDSLETSLLVEHLKELRAGRPVDIPIYDFAIHNRSKQTLRVEPARVILVEGILIFVEPALREMMDMRIFVDTDADIRFIRRLRRDMVERGRTLDSVVKQYLSTVRPMHMEFVEPSKRYADIIVPQGGDNRVAMEMIVSRIRAVLNE
ncbi:uridine kinase [Caldilinea sp.]|uniref:uridine kinase n=1 Tax=Caldilinea sp. TaxID=2293560 RepID=UPI0021DDF123|nr:uridine kinase [Caldilinea sp.]GIV69108.1 MAG: uridine kinase [Caldilinea sp.]